MSSPFWIFLWASIFSMLGGLGYLYRTKEVIKLRDVISAILNNGICGTALAMIWYYRFQEQIYILIGLCGLIGLMGPPAVDWVISKLKSGSLKMNFSKTDGELEVKDDTNKTKLS